MEIETKLGQNAYALNKLMNFWNLMKKPGRADFRAIKYVFHQPPCFLRVSCREPSWHALRSRDVDVWWF